MNMKNSVLAAVPALLPVASGWAREGDARPNECQQVQSVHAASCGYGALSLPAAYETPHWDPCRVRRKGRGTDL